MLESKLKSPIQITEIENKTWIYLLGCVVRTNPTQNKSLPKRGIEVTFLTTDEMMFEDTDKNPHKEVYGDFTIYTISPYGISILNLDEIIFITQV